MAFRFRLRNAISEVDRVALCFALLAVAALSYNSPAPFVKTSVSFGHDEQVPHTAVSVGNSTQAMSVLRRLVSLPGEGDPLPVDDVVEVVFQLDDPQPADDGQQDSVYSTLVAFLGDSWNSKDSYYKTSRYWYSWYAFISRIVRSPANPSMLLIWYLEFVASIFRGIYWCVFPPVPTWGNYIILFVMLNTTLNLIIIYTCLIIVNLFMYAGTLTECAFGALYYRYSSRKRSVQVLPSAQLNRVKVALPAYPTKTQTIDGNTRLVPDHSPQAYLDSFTGHVISSTEDCAGCRRGGCVRGLGQTVVVLPGVAMSPIEQVIISKRPNLFIVPKKKTVHVDIVTSAGTPSTRVIREFVHKKVAYKGVHLNSLQDKCEFDVYTVVPCEHSIIVPKPNAVKVVDGYHFLIDHEYVTMLSPRQTIPLSLITGISSRLVTDDVAPVKFYDHIRTFFASKTIALQIKPLKPEPWILLIADLVARDSMSAMPSIRAPLRFDANVWDRIWYNIAYYVGRCNGFSSQPSNASFDFLDHPVPTYEVYTDRFDTNSGEAFKPEKAMPFPILGPATDPQINGEPECSTRPDRSKHSLIHGEEGTRTPTNPEPVDNRPGTSKGNDMDACSSSGVSIASSPCSDRDGVDGRTERPQEDDETVRGFGRRVGDYITPDTSKPPLAAQIGEASITCLPVVRHIGGKRPFCEWELSIQEDGFGLQALLACFECACRVARESLGQSKRTFHAVAEAFSKTNKRSGCATNTRGLPISGSCALARARVPKSEMRSERDEPAATPPLRRMGEQVPLGKTSTAKGGDGASGEGGRTEERRRNSEVLSENGDDYESDGSEEHQPQKRRFFGCARSKNQRSRKAPSSRKLSGKGPRPSRPRHQNDPPS